VRQLATLVLQQIVIIPESVSRELRVSDDNLSAWLRKNRSVALRETSENTKFFQMIALKYRDLIGESTRAADPMVLALALYYKKYGVLTDDDGLAAACFAEQIQCIRVAAFKKLEGLS